MMPTLRHGAAQAMAAVAPTVRLERAFMAMLDDFDAHDPNNGAFYAPARQDFAAYVQQLLDEEAGRHLREGFVPCTHRWLVTDTEQLAGVTRLRHHINTPFLAENGGHIGYDVAPSHRRRGWGHFALATAHKDARQIGLTRVLLYAAEDNTASRAIIVRAGGELESVRYSEFWEENLCKYWVPIEASTVRV